MARYQRREFLIGSAATAAGLIVASALPGCHHGPPAELTALKVFKPEEAWTLDAVLEQLLPASPGMPGAREARVLDYFDRELQKPDLKQLQSAMRYGMQVLSVAAKKLGKGNYAELAHDQQTAVLQQFEANTLHIGKEDTSPVFNHLLAFSIEGYLCDPKYGGNFQCKGWQAVGFMQGCAHG